MEKRRFVIGQPGVDPVFPDVELEINGRVLALAFDFASIALAERETGENLLRSCFQVPTFAGTAALLYAAALKAQPDFTVAEAEELVDLQTLPLIVEAVRTAWQRSLPEPKAEDEAAGEAEAPESGA